MFENCHLYSLPPGAKGFDCNAIVDEQMLKAAKAKRFTHIGRYVRRVEAHDYDLTTEEAVRITDAGFGLYVIQHVAPAGWRPNGGLGFQYGRTCADEMDHIGLPHGTIAVLDLEGVATKGVTAAQVIDYCNQWHSVVASRGFVPALYIGWHSGLSGADAYWKLRFTRYIGAYNVNADQKPVVRGFQMQQAKQITVGSIQVDPQTANPDKLGSSFVVLRREDGLSLAPRKARRSAGAARKRSTKPPATTSPSD